MSEPPPTEPSPTEPPPTEPPPTELPVAARERDVDLGRQHTVLASADGRPFTSLRHRAVLRTERFALGRALRERAHRSDLGEWEPPAERYDPVEMVRASHEGRAGWLVPIRVGRMVRSPYGFLRASAGIMAYDFASLPATGITPVICGDAHLGNFGFYASPERQLVFDLNDFDEAHPGPWEWDVRRLVVSVWVAGRLNGSKETQCEDAVLNCVSAYREQLGRLAVEPLLARSYERLDVDRLRETARDKGLREEIDRSARRARRRTSDRALPRFTSDAGGERRIVEEPPLLTRLSEDEAEALSEALDAYLLTLPPHWARVLAGYTLVDIAHKVVGVGSVGLRAYVALCEGSSPDDAVFLQVKQARRSVVARFMHGESAWHSHQGQRVVEYQQTLQTVSDPLLGWTSAHVGEGSGVGDPTGDGGRVPNPAGDGELQFYVRQFRDMKGAITIEGIDPAALADYAAICGYLLAKGHARTSGASMIAGYLGSSDKADQAFAAFARRYADQTERDHEAIVDAVRRGVLPCEAGI